jgi:hypothetical protein
MLFLAACGPGASGDESSAADEALSTSWEIGGMLDEFVLDARFEPPRPKSGQPVTLIAIGSSDDMDRPFKGEVWYRVSPSGEGQEPWLPMTPAEEKDGEATFRVTVALPKGKPFVQFKVKRIYDAQAAELLDWWIPVD